MKKTFTKILILITTVAFLNIFSTNLTFAENNEPEISKNELIANYPIIPKPGTLPGPDESIQKNDGNSARQTLVRTLIPRYTTMLAGMAAAASFLFLIVAGVRFATVYGNDEAYEKAKKQAIYALVGLLISILAYTIVTIIINIDIVQEKNTSTNNNTKTEEKANTSPETDTANPEK